jgi:hypothetical protein
LNGTEKMKKTNKKVGQIKIKERKRQGKKAKK